MRILSNSLRSNEQNFRSENFYPMQMQFVEGPEEPNRLEPVYDRQPGDFKFKICLIGDGGTGKTTFINKVLNGDFINKYYATQGAVTKFLKLSIGNGSTVRYEVWDTAGQEKNVGLKDGYYIGAIAGFFFFDVTSRESMSNIPKYLKSFVNACGVENPKMYILGNKIDIARKKVDISKLLPKIKMYNAEIIQISAKTGHNFSMPFEKLTKALFNDNNLMIYADISLTPLTTSYDYLAGEQNQHVPDNAADFVPEDNEFF